MAPAVFLPFVRAKFIQYNKYKNTEYNILFKYYRNSHNKKILREKSDVVGIRGVFFLAYIDIQIYLI